MSSTYLMNNIPRGTSREKLIHFLVTLKHSQLGDEPQASANFIRSLVIADSKLNPKLSVATIEFSDAPKWLQHLNQDPYGFPKKTALGTIWKGVDMTATNENGQTEFIRAAIEGNLMYAKLLAEFKNSNVNIQDKQGRTALHWACAKNLLKITKLCLPVPGLDIGIRDEDEGDLMAFDISIGNDETTPLHRAARNGERKMVQALLRWGAKTDVTDERAREHMEAARVLLETKDQDGWTALHLAVLSGDLATVGMLLDLEADKEAKEENQQTALHLAAENGHWEIAKVLLDQGAEIEATNKWKQTALQLAAGMGHLVVGEVLLDLGANLEARDKRGRTALHLAAQEGRKDFVQLLLDWRADIEANNSDRKTPLHLAMDNNELNEVVLLMKHGARLGEKGREWCTGLRSVTLADPDYDVKDEIMCLYIAVMWGARTIDKMAGEVY